jgi:hypothetical protein
LQRGYAFRLEREMLSSAKRWLDRQRLYVKTEFYTPWGVCDLVGISLFKTRVRQRLDLGQRSPIGPLRRIALLDQIPDFESQVSVTSSQLAARLRKVYSECEIDKQLDRLIANGFVLSNEPGRFQKLNGWAPLHKRIVAFELKLHRVDEALFQATSHLQFATESYVGLPDGVALRVMHGASIEGFKRSGIGLVAVGPNRCRLLYRPHARCEQTDPILQMHCVERFWRSHVIGN